MDVGFCLVVIFALLPRGSYGQSSKAFVQALEFGAENRSQMFLEVTPNQAALTSLDFSICFRIRLWNWGPTVVFETKGMYAMLNGFDDNMGFFSMSESVTFPNDALKVSPNLWNSVCFVHNLTNATLMVAINDNRTVLNSSMLKNDNLTGPVFIGSNPNWTPENLRFSVQVVDFNFWNRVLSPADVLDFISSCSEKLFQE